MEKWFLSKILSFHFHVKFWREIWLFFFHSEDDSMWKVYGKINSNLILSYCSRTYFAWSELSFMYIVQE